MPIDAKAVADYAAELADAAGIPADQRPAFLSNEKVLATARKRFEDVEREKGRFAAEQQRANEIEAKRKEEYENNLKIFNENKKVVDEAQKRVQAYVEQYGELPGGGDPNDPGARRAAVTDAIDKKSLEAELGKRDALTIGLVVAASKITARHLKTFNEEPDFDAIQKIAVEQGLNAEKAYEAWVAPKVAERQNAEFEAKLKAARDEGLKEGISKSAAGTIADSEPKSAFMENLRKSGEVKNSARDAFLQGWREPVGAKQ